MTRSWFLPRGWGQCRGCLSQSGPSPGCSVRGLSPFLPTGEPTEPGAVLSLWRCVYTSAMKSPLKPRAAGKELS